MKTYIAAAIVALVLTSCTNREKGSSLAIPNPLLLGCNSASCERLWKDYPAAQATYPQQLTIDFKGDLPYGLTAKYDKSTPVDAIKVGVDKDYAKWTVPGLSGSPVMMWRVEPAKFTIQLSTADDGARQLIYLSLRPELR
jgi:hypothetical protein